MKNKSVQQFKKEPILKEGVKPFLKWAGGKRALIHAIMAVAPKNYDRYFEPFLGGGALFFTLKPKKAFLSDINFEITNTYRQIQRNPQNVINLLKKINHSKEMYYKIRRKRSRSEIQKASRFIYLNRTCWNGLYRENQKGEFNVPIGKYKNPIICDKENLMRVSALLNNARALICKADFEKQLEKAKKGDFVYLDPPYVTTHKNNGFLQYNKKIFSLEDQKRLYNVFVGLDKKGCKVVLSNADHDFISDLYSSFNVHPPIRRGNTLAALPNKRGLVTELLITNY